MPDRENANRVYATTINTTTGGGFFFVSSDGGASWQPSMRNMPPRLIGYSILQDERDGNLIYLGTNLGLYKSTDRGASWAPVSGRKTPAAPARKRPAANTVRRTVAQKRASANERGAGSTSSSPQRTAADKTSDAVVRRAQEALERAGYEIGNPDGQLGPRTVAAIKRFQTDRYLTVSGQLDEATIAALGVNGGTNGNIQSHVANISDPVNALESFSDRTGQIQILAATNSGLYRTTDPGQGWDRLPYGPSLDARTTSISTSTQNPSVILVGTTTTGVLISRDAGQSWQQVSGIPATSPVNVIAQDPQRSAFVYVGTKQAFYMSHDGGEHWFRRGGNLPFGDLHQHPDQSQKHERSICR